MNIETIETLARFAPPPNSKTSIPFKPTPRKPCSKIGRNETPEDVSTLAQSLEWQEMEIVENIIKETFIYKLLDDCGAVVYIGQSSNPKSRILTHIKEGKKFSKVLTAKCDHRFLTAVENNLIRRFDPQFNKYPLHHKQPAIIEQKNPAP